MDAIISFVIYGAVMVYCLVRDISPAWSLVAAAACFFAVGLRRRYPVKELLKMSWSNMPASLKVLRILVILGALTGLWRSCGTIPFCIYYGIRYISPGMFILVTFAINLLLSLALGTSLGVSSTSGVVLISLARFGGVDPLICAGAVMSGIYFGDRAAPTSSCANLVAAITDTGLYDNIRLMHRSGLPAYIISFAFYAVLSVMNPINAVDEAMMNALSTEFSLSLWAVLPAVIMIALPLLKVPLFISMAASGGCALLVSVFCQHMSLSKVLYTAVMGFKPDGGMLADVITGGGVISMIMSLIMVSAAGILTGLLQGMGILNGIQAKLSSWAKKLGRIKLMDLLAIACCMIFCNQTTSNIMQAELMRSAYPEGEKGNSELALDISNTGVLLAGLIPWCVACSIPLNVLGVGPAALPYAVLLYALPITYIFTKKRFFEDR